MSDRLLIFPRQRSVTGSAAMVWLALVFGIAWGSALPVYAEPTTADSAAVVRPVFPSTPT